MDSVLEYLNKNFCFGFVNKKQIVCRFSGTGVWNYAGTERVCSRKEMRRWKRISESQRATCEVALQVGDPLVLDDYDGHPGTFYVIDMGTNAKGEVEYILGR